MQSSHCNGENEITTYLMIATPKKEFNLHDRTCHFPCVDAFFLQTRQYPAVMREDSQIVDRSGSR